MKIFEKLAESLGEGLTATLVIKMTSAGKMTVCTNFTTAGGGIADSLTPFTLKGTPQEMDEGFIDAIQQPIETVKGLVSNMEQFKKAAEQTEKAAKKSTVKTPISASEAAMKAEEERKRKEAEAKARKENFDKAIAAAKVANAHGNYFTAEALLNLAASLTDDKKTKADLVKQIKPLQDQKSGFLCNDDEKSAQTAIETFKNAMVKPQTEEKPAEAPAEAEQAEEPVDIEIEDTDAETNESDAEDDSANVEAA